MRKRLSELLRERAYHVKSRIHFVDNKFGLPSAARALTLIKQARLALVAATLLCGAASIVAMTQQQYAIAAETTQDTITVETIPGATVTDKVTDKARTSWPWYVCRASGLIAAVSLVLLIVSGVGQVTGFTYRLLEPLTAWASHRALGIVFGISILLHVGSLLFDHFLPFNILHLLVPWLSDYKPVTLFGIHLGSLYLALGIIALYLTAAIVISSLMWIDKKPHTWKWLHMLSYLVIIFVFVHALYLGTDVSHGWVRIAWLGCAACMVLVGVHRSWRAYTV